MTVANKLYTVKDVADYVGVTTHAVILAEKEGRIPPAMRDEIGHRVYTAQDRERVGALMGRR